MMKIGMLTSGGDCQALNAAMRGVVKGLTTNVDELEIYGFENGYKGLIYEQYRILTASDFSGILTRGGTILGSSRQPFKQMRVPDENGLDKVEAMKSTYRKLGLDCLVILGGNGTQKTANLLREEGLNIIHLPKTIDNDIYGTDVTFGFQSAINIATETIDCIHTTAASHNRVFIVEVMGHKVGWLTLYAGVAFCSRRFRMILIRSWMRFISVQKTEKDLRFLQLQKVQSPKTMHSLPRSSTRQKLHPAGIHRFLMRLQIRFRRNAVWKSALRFRATHSVAVVRVHMTEYYVPVLDLPLPKQLWMENLAA